jgi:hypothetical protein
VDYSVLTLDDIIEKERECGVPHGPFWQAKYLDRAPERVRRQLELAQRFPYLVATRDTKEAPAGLIMDFPVTTFTPVTAAAETDMWTPAVWTPIPANDASAGMGYIVSFGGIYSNRTTSSPTSLWTPRWGQGASTTGVALGPSGAVYSGAALTNAPLFGEFEFTVVKLGSSGTGTGNGIIIRGGTAGVGLIRDAIGGLTATIDTTTAQGLKMAHTWSAANASNTLTVQWVFLRTRN